MFAVCNGLDVRALYYNKTALDSKGFQPPTTIAELDELATAFSPISVTSSSARNSASGERLAESSRRQTYGYLPDSRRLWAWGFVFGGDFLSTEGQVELNTPAIRAALEWMASYPRRYGADEIAAFRQGDQSLPGKTFPLLPVLDDETVGRYVLIMDGQWRVREIGEFQQRRSTTGLEVPEFGVCPLPVPVGGDRFTPRTNAGWVNGNFFVVPQGAKNTAGAWEFMKFWIGYTDPEVAAETCAQGGWIPVSTAVIDTEHFQEYLNHSPLFRSFVELASSENQFPTPLVPGASMFRRTVEDAAYEAMTYPQKPVEQILAEAEFRIQKHLERARQSLPADPGID